MKLEHVAAAALPLLVIGSLGTDAGAYRQPDHLDERSMETAAGPRGRAARVVEWQAPAASRAAWDDFVAARGPWRAVWDADTAVPLRMWGKGIAAPGAIASAEAAEAKAREVLAAELALLAPGASAHDFELAANVVHAGGTMRTVSFWQTRDGMRVEGAAVNFLFKQDRLFVIGSTAARELAVTRPATMVGAGTAEAAAVGWIDDLFGARPSVLETRDAVVLPLVRERDDHRTAVEHHVVIPVVVDLAEPRGRWTVYVDAVRGTPVARTQLLRFGSGTVKYRVPVRWPGSDKAEYPAAFADHTIGGVTVASDIAGLFSWSGTAAASVSAGLRGAYVRVRTTGTAASTTLSVPDGGSATWDQTTVERADAQLTAFIHANLIKEFARTTIDPGMAWLGEQLQVYVNESGSCNAYSTGDDIHFYPRSNQCENTGRLADVIYHEFGHSIHNHAIIPGAGSWDGALSEGISDFLAATYTGDHGMARGFFLNDEPMRDLDPVGGEMQWGIDTNGQVHNDGQVIGGTLWDLRKALIAALGEGPGRTHVDDIWYAIISRANDIPSSYPEALALDDDDGDLSNGTPNKCLIDAAFAAHNLADPGEVAAGSIDPPRLEGLTLTLTPGEVQGACPPPEVESARATWRVRGGGDTGSVDFAAAGTDLTAALPAQPDGTVIEYQVEVTFADGGTHRFPKNEADPWYETYVGPVTVLRCFDFEGPDHGWTLGEEVEVGAPTSGNTSDPAAAFSGSNLLGIDLTLDGNYEPNRTYSAASPEVAIEGTWDGIRLQYRRWLTVEDATYDHATLSVDGVEKFHNLETPDEDTHHRDREWMFRDLDITAEAADGAVAISLGLTSDAGLEFGGWSVDDVCIVAMGGTCGDGLVSSVEECDDGNGDAGDGCAADCTTEDPDDPGPGDDPDDGDATGGCCSTSDRGATGWLVLAALTLLGLRRRRAA